jgi:hypothetical protein
MRVGSLISSSLLLFLAGTSPHLSAPARGFVRGGRGMSTSRVISPGVVASWVSHENYANGNKTTLLVLWRARVSLLCDRMRPRQHLDAVAVRDYAVTVMNSRRNA